MTDNEIIKALECCSEAIFKEDCIKLKCPFFDNEIYNCMNVDDEDAMHRYSLDLINRQKAEIERLNSEIDEISIAYSELETQKDYLYDEAKALIERDKQSKSEAIREFAEKLKNVALPIKIGGKYEYEVVTKQAIDHFVKEMTEDSGNEK